MEKNKLKKLNKATVATILATSGIAVVVPPPASAGAFKDLNPKADYYGPVLDLAGRGIINGYSDGTFRPNKAVTRGQAAKMLASALKLNLKNVKNPHFNDVPTNHQFYPYIAALAQEGIINGYSDQTFQPNEPITRGQIAKILTLGYRFGVASKLTHHFEDVTNKNSNAYYIQTLVNLNITKGVSPVSFKPFDPITRGQLATFIVRAEKADGSGIAVNTVGKIENNKVYINSVPYTIDSSLASIFNESNEAVLQGAFVEGNFSGKTIKSVSKLTINANGSENRKLQFDGKNSSYNGHLVVNGNYVQFKNWTITGTVTIGETPRKTLSYYTNRLQNIRIASLNGVGFIDWTQPTEPEDDEFLNPDDNEQLNDKPSNNGSKVVPHMPVTERYVDFTNCAVERLMIEQNRTYVTGDKKISAVTVQKDVQQFEINTDAKTMYIESDASVIMYGSSDIEKVYKNSYYDVYFNSNSYIDILAIDNSYGWIDIGDNAYVDKAILPVGKGVNDIFDDFTNDGGNIGDIEDENGDDVDETPGDDIIPDTTNPTIIDLDVLSAAGNADVQLTADEDGTYYYVVREAEDSPPSVKEIVVGPMGTGQVKANEVAYFKVTGLEEEKNYVIYVVVADNADNLSKWESVGFTTTDGTPPKVNSLKATALHGGQRIQFSFNPSEIGEYYYYIREKSTFPDPTTEEIIEYPSGRGTVTSVETITHIINGLKNNKEYELYVVMKDKYGNISDDPPAKDTVTTGDLDNTHPYVVGSAPDKDRDLVPYGENQFYLYFSEELDKESAENIQNYDLSGTGIINVTGQKVIKPSKAVYTFDSKGSRVLLTVPSFTGFVHGDTLRVTVLRNVKDIADNTFENDSTVNAGETPRNYAEYRHDDTIAPVLTIDEVKMSTSKVEVEFETNKAGTYYYMIMPDDVDLTNIEPRDFVDEFSSDPSKITGKFQDYANKDIYLYKEGNKPAVLGSQKFDITVPTNTDPFTSYAVYMVLRDRSGNLSEIKSKVIINDSKVPEITGVSVKSVNNNDTQAVLSFNSSEKGTVFYKAIKKWVLQDGVLVKNPLIYDGSGNLKPLPGTYEYGKLSGERKAAFLGYGGVQSASMAEGLAGNNFLIRNLDRHEEYVLYFGVEDTYGNFTVKLPETNPPQTEIENLYMIKPFYTDGTKPEINPVIKKLLLTEFNDIDTTGITYVEDQTFTITFSEAIALSTGAAIEKPPLSDDADAQNNVLNALKAGIESVLGTRADITSIAWQDLEGVDTWEPRKLIFTLSDEIESDVTINMNSAVFSNIKDLGIQPFDEDKSIGDYKYPTKSNKILYARLQPDIQFSDLDISKVLNVMAELNVDLSWDQKFYCAVTTTDYPLTRADMEEVIRRADTNSRQLIPGASIISYGTGVLTMPSDASSVKTFTAIQSTDNNASTNVFVTNQRVYLFTKDKYGNIVFAKDTSLPDSPDYVKIQPRIN